MASRGLILAASAAATVVIAWSSVYVQDTTEHVVVTRFGDPIRIDDQPGLRLRLPLGVDRVNRISNKLHLLLPSDAEYLTSDKKNLIVSSFLLWKVAEPLKYLQSVEDREGAEARLSFVLSSEIGNAMGNTEFEDILAEDADAGALVAMSEELLTRCRGIAVDEYGIEVVDVRIRRLGFPELNRVSVFERMRAERKRIAVKIRSEGEEEATKIRSEADVERSRILSDANREADEIRGHGEAEAAQIFGEAIREDPAFYEFLRTLEAYDKIVDEETTLVLPADAELLELLLDGPGGGL